MNGIISPTDLPSTLFPFRRIYLVPAFCISILFRIKIALTKIVHFVTLTINWSFNNSIFCERRPAASPDFESFSQMGDWESMRQSLQNKNAIDLTDTDSPAATTTTALLSARSSAPNETDTKSFKMVVDQLVIQGKLEDIEIGETLNSNKSSLTLDEPLNYLGKPIQAVAKIYNIDNNDHTFLYLDEGDSWPMCGKFQYRSNAVLVPSFMDAMVSHVLAGLDRLWAENLLPCFYLAGSPELGKSVFFQNPHPLLSPNIWSRFCNHCLSTNSSGKPFVRVFSRKDV